MRRFNSTNSQDIALEMAKYRVHKIRRFYTHLLIYIIALMVYLTKTYLGAPFNFWPIRDINETIMWIWTFIIAVQGIRLFFREKVFDTAWEQRKVQEYMNHDKQNKWE